MSTDDFNYISSGRLASPAQGRELTTAVNPRRARRSRLTTGDASKHDGQLEQLEERIITWLGSSGNLPGELGQVSWPFAGVASESVG